MELYRVFLRSLSTQYYLNSGFDNRDLAQLTSYFWGNLNSEFKTEMRQLAQNVKAEKKLKRLSGFWLFAKELEYHMLRNQLDFVECLWDYFNESYKSMWKTVQCNAICSEVWFARTGLY